MYSLELVSDTVVLRSLENIAFGDRFPGDGVCFRLSR